MERLTRPLREAESNGVRCRWNPAKAFSAETFHANIGAWRDALSTEILDHAVTFSALREQPYAPEVDPVVEAVRDWLSGGAMDRPEQTTYSALASTIRPLVLASTPTDALVGELVKRKSTKCFADRHISIGRNYWVEEGDTLVIIPREDGDAR